MGWEITFYPNNGPRLLFDYWELANKLGMWIRLLLMSFPKMRSSIKSRLVVAICGWLQNEYLATFNDFCCRQISPLRPFQLGGGAPLLLLCL